MWNELEACKADIATHEADKKQLALTISEKESDIEEL